ncbi:MAG: carboxypeptidase M32 [Phycisphaerales bacterium]|nr:carboxypeptidase M32 [Phycisphaerales bacterium]
MNTTSTATTAHPTWKSLTDRVIEVSTLGSCAAVLHWDQETKMPPEGIEPRGKQLAVLARLAHEMATSEEVGDLLSACEQTSELTEDTASDTAVTLQRLRHDYDRATCISPELVSEEALLASQSQHHWAEARRNDDFTQFQPYLEQVVDLLRRKAVCFGWAEGGEPWDALAEDYEPGCTAAWVESVFTPLRDRLQGLLDRLMGSSTAPSNAFNELCLPIDAQEAFVTDVASSIGFDFQRGRIDVSTHPFCTGFHPKDVRITTRFHENNVNDALGSTMHECGHAIYEQGLRQNQAGLPLGKSVSLGIHESQSRLWENQVGRSRQFWQWCFPKLGEYFGGDVSSLDLDSVYRGANIVRPDFIRVEADEATYNMHIMIRFELERSLLKGDLAVADVPAAWAEKYRDYLGIEVPCDSKGCLQDIHWSMVSMGYFPTYTLGNLYSAQFFDAAKREISGLEDGFAKGEFEPLKVWLNEKIHHQGRRYLPADLCEVVTGTPLSADYLMTYLETKLGEVYGL